MTKTTKVDIEATITQLAAIIDKLEDGEVSIQDSLGTFEQGINLTRQAQQTLLEAEQKVTSLLDNSGDPNSQNFDDSSAE